MAALEEKIGEMAAVGDLMAIAYRSNPMIRAARAEWKIALADTTLVDEFVYKAKKTVSSKIAVVNATCPITGGALRSDDVAEKLTRDYKGQKIGFCCDGCPDAWDKLTYAEKDASLAKAKKPGK